MAVGVLTDDKLRYRKAVNLYHATVRDYTKWGRAKGFRDGGRVLGETSETLRDIYHTQVSPRFANVRSRHAEAAHKTAQ
jgi:hypothetical protein